MTWGQGRNQTLAKKVLAKGNHICHVCHKPGADQADHIIPLAEGGTDDEPNMAPIHAKPCHANKTKAEAARGKQRHSRRRTTQQHPGMI